MEEKSIEVVPVYIEKGKAVDVKLSADYQAFVKAGPWADGGELRTQVYLKAKAEEEYKPVSLAVKMTETQAAQVKAVTVEPKGYPYRKYLGEESGWIYFLPKGIHGQFKTGGKETIQIRFADGRTESMTLLVRGTEEEEDFYQDLILDLISMDQQLCMDNKSAMSMAKDWSKHLYEQTEMQIQTFREAFSALEKKALTELKPFRAKQPFCKIKKMTPKALIEHEIFHREKVSAVFYREDFDTFEHRVIKTHLGRLRKLVKIRRKMEISALENEQARLQQRLHFSEEKLRERIEELEDRLEKAERKERKRWEDNVKRRFPAVPLQGGVTVEFHTLQAEGEKPDILQFNIQKGRPYIKVNNVEGYQITVPVDCAEAAAVLFHAFRSGEQEGSGNKIARICGDILDTEEYFGEKDPLGFDFRKITELNGFSVEQRSREEIERMKEELHDYIFGPLFDQMYSGGNDLEHLGFYRAASGRGELLKKLDQQILDLKKQENRWTELEEMLDRIDKSPLMKATKPVRTPIRTSNLFAFHPAYQKMYAVMLADNQKMASVDYYAEDRADEFSVAKLPDLYEIWCCLKLAQILIQNYKFRLNIRNLEESTGMDSLAEYIREILSGGKINGSRFDLQGDVNGQTMDVVLCYDRKIYDPQGIKNIRPDFTMEMRMGDKTRRFVLDAKYKGKHTGTPPGKKSVRREVSYEDGLPDFCDACEVQCYDGIQELCEVAFDKYTRRLVHEIGAQEFDGSFIIHSCTDAIGPKKITPENAPDVEVTYNPKNYLGAYPDALAQQLWKKKCEENQWNVDVNRLLEWTGWSNGENNHENRLGVLTANPKENYLPNLLQMIMERHFGAYRDRCWLCGSKRLQIEEKLTESGFSKYHITCKNPECKSFMVETHCADSKCHGKLGKHLDNYFAQKKSEDDDAHWNVVCPKCRKRLETRKNGSEATFQKIAPSPARDFSPPPWESFRGRGL